MRPQAMSPMIASRVGRIQSRDEIPNFGEPMLFTMRLGLCSIVCG
jgi:hypothetical protein